MSAVSKNVTPASSAASTTARVPASSMRPPKLLQPRPTTVTSRDRACASASRNGTERAYAQVASRTRNQLRVRDLRDGRVVVACAAQRVDELREAGDAAELGRHDGAVEIRAERDVVDRPSARRSSRRGARSPSSASSARSRRPRAGSVTAKLTPTTPPESRIASSCSSVRFREDAHSAWAFECVATSGASERRATSQKPASLRCERSTRIPSRLQARTSSRPASVSPAPVSGERGEPERDALGELVRPRPDEPDRAKAALVPALEIREVGRDRLGALQVHDRRHAARPGSRRSRSPRVDRQLAERREELLGDRAPPPRAGSARRAAPRTGSPSGRAPCGDGT